MEIFGTKFSLALGAWRLRFVLMLEDAEAAPAASPPQPPVPHRYEIHSPPSVSRN